jgi:hypothetical protein
MTGAAHSHCDHQAGPTGPVGAGTGRGHVGGGGGGGGGSGSFERFDTTATDVRPQTRPDGLSFFSSNSGAKRGFRILRESREQWIVNMMQSVQGG